MAGAGALRERRAAPLAVVEEIPLRAAGRDAVFLFGTLMDVDILAALLARPIRPEERMAARLAGFRRVRAAEACYPILVPDPEAEVEGVLLLRPSAEDLRRINHYESDEYRAALFQVRGADGRRYRAWVFQARPEVLTATEQPWDFESWARRHKAGFFARIAEWMADYPESDQPEPRNRP